MRTDPWIDDVEGGPPRLTVGLEHISSNTGCWLDAEVEFAGRGVLFEPNWLLYGKLRPYLNKVALTNTRGSAVGDFHVFSARRALRPDYLQYLMLSDPMKCYLSGAVHGAKMPRVSWDVVASAPVAVPPTKIQESLVVFLDTETARIDTLIDKQKRLIELLKEKRQAVISQAVTKGLDPDVPTKDSGVEWLGEVPAHWTRLSLGLLCTVVRGASPRPAGDSRYFNGEHIPWVTVSELSDDSRLHISSTKSYLTEQGMTQSRVFRKGTLLVSNSGTIGATKVLKVDACGNDGVLGIEALSPRLDKYFLRNWFRASRERLLNELRQGTIQANLNTDLVSSQGIVLPPLHEQNAITEHISAVSATLDVLEEKAIDLISFLRERRTALITAAVTGQIDVTNYKPGNVEPTEQEAHPA